MQDTIFPLDVNGYYFVNWSDAGRQLGYKCGTSMKLRYEKMKDTHSLEEIFVARVVEDSIFPLDVNGYHFMHWTDAGRQLGYISGKSIESLYNKMKDTHSLEEIFVPKVVEDSIFPLDVNGYHFTKWKDVGKQLGYRSGQPIKRRYEKMKDTHTLEEIFVPKGYGTLFPLDINGYHFISWNDAGKQLGYGDGTSMMKRYEKMKDTHTLEEIFVARVVEDSIFPIDVNGYHFMHWADAGRQLGYRCGLSIKNRYNKMKDTHPLEEIFVPKVVEDSIFPLDVNGYHFTNWTDAGNQLGYYKANAIKVYYEKMKDTHSLEEIFVPKVIKKTIFPLNICGYCFTSWKDIGLQLGCENIRLFKIRYYNGGWSLKESLGFSIHIQDKKPTQVTDNLTCQIKISNNLYKCKNKNTGLFELHTYEELNEMWRKYNGVKIVKED